QLQQCVGDQGAVTDDACLQHAEIPLAERLWQVRGTAKIQQYQVAVPGQQDIARVRVSVETAADQDLVQPGIQQPAENVGDGGVVTGCAMAVQHVGEFFAVHESGGEHTFAAQRVDSIGDTHTVDVFQCHADLAHRARFSAVIQFAAYRALDFVQDGGQIGGRQQMADTVDEQ